MNVTPNNVVLTKNKKDNKHWMGKNSTWEYVDQNDADENNVTNVTNITGNVTNVTDITSLSASTCVYFDHHASYFRVT